MEHPYVILEQRDFLAVYKPAGLLVHPIAHAAKHPGRSKTEPTLAEWLVKRYPELGGVGDDPRLRPGIVHRLDKDVSGVLLVARTQKSFLYFKGLFGRREMAKEYRALVWGSVRERRGVISAPMGIVSGSLKRSIRGKKLKLVKDAVTEYAVIHGGELSGRPVSFLAVSPKTGRTHQIRLHLAHIGHPIVGDRLYGGKAGRDVPEEYARRIFLHAYALEFVAPEGGRMRIEAELPDAFTRILHIAA